MKAGKRSLAIDIRNPECAAIVRTLARTADIFIENFRPVLPLPMIANTFETVSRRRSRCSGRNRDGGAGR
ncbi:MAG: CoA transferase [Pseudomonadota bacterium]